MGREGRVSIHILTTMLARPIRMVRWAVVEALAAVLAVASK